MKQSFLLRSSLDVQVNAGVRLMRKYVSSAPLIKTLLAECRQLYFEKASIRTPATLPERGGLEGLALETQRRRVDRVKEGTLSRRPFATKISCFCPSFSSSVPLLSLPRSSGLGASSVEGEGSPGSRRDKQGVGVSAV